MDYKRLNKIKDLIYETEGLLELLQLRPDKLEALSPLIKGRLDEAASAFKEFDGDQSGPEEEAGDGKKYDVTSVEREPLGQAASGGRADDVAPAGTVHGTFSPESGRQSAPSGADVDPGIKRPAPAFCLNDRFRFRRAIFGGSDAEFSSTMSHIATLSGYSDAEEYFYGDMGLDPDNEDVADFMEIIKTYFGR